MFSLLGKAAMCIVPLISATATGYVYYHGGMADAPSRDHHTLGRMEAFMELQGR